MERRRKLGIERLRGIKLTSPMKSIGMKLFLIFFVSIVSFVLSCGMLSYSISKNVIQKKVSQSSLETISQAGMKLDFMYKTFEDVMLQMNLDNDLQNLLAKVQQFPPGSYQAMEIAGQLTEKLNVIAFSGKSISSLLLFQPDGRLIALTGSGSNSAIENVGQTDWFQAIMNNNDQTQWLDSKAEGYSGSYTNTFAIGRVLKNGEAGSEGVLVMEVGTELLNNELNSLSLGEGSQLSITNPANMNIATLSSGELGKASRFPLTSSQMEAGRGLFTSANDHIVVYYHSTLSDWNMVGDIPIGLLVREAADKIFQFTLVAVLCAAIAAGLIGIWVARVIVRPIQKLRDLMKQGSQGRLAVRANYTSKDEVGQLGASFDQMMQHFADLVRQSGDTAHNVLETANELASSARLTKTAADEIAAAMEEISTGATGLAQESEKGKALTEHVSMQMKQVTEANFMMGTAAAGVQEAGMRGAQEMDALMANTNRTEEMIFTLIKKVGAFKESTSSIQSILDMLNQIMKKTNILSLNAGIEAVRAGQAGKGFMVVADEIRHLAEQSRHSIGVVGQMMNDIQNEVHETFNLLESAAPIFKTQLQAVRDTNVIFGQVTTQMTGFIEQLSAVSDSVSSLEDKQVVLSDTMMNVSAVAEESLATSEEVTAQGLEQSRISDRLVRLSDQLEQLSQGLHATLSKFEM
ncbi:methyl-accepting chemotaxis protein [Paenibacillus oryzisoli]|uniref:methyl-accepting chemotaxis protein n=1 Tax=Paenibacillus oryzisoli TaxID=1850517 RepID=UPI003D2A45DB